MSARAWSAILSACMTVASAWAQPAPGVAPAEDEARNGIERVLAAMSSAVLTADAPAYLDRVWMDDANWATEQRNWAADLARHAPVEYRMTLVGPVVLSDGWADAELRTSWRMETGRERSVAFPVRFASRGGAWLYAGERWRVLERDGVRVLFPEGFAGAAEAVADALPEVRGHVHEGFELEGSALAERVQEVKLYASMTHLQQSIYPSYADPLSGWNEPGESIKLMASAVRRSAAARLLLAHEYGHVATFEFGDHASAMPWWVLEGVAELAAERYAGGDSDRLVRLWAATGGLIEWDRLADFRGEAREHSLNVYRQGHHMLGYVSERFGRAARNRWLRAMAGGAPLDEATRDTLGLPFAELDAQWRASLAPGPAR